MLVLRFQRTGRKNVPAFRLVLTEKTAPPKGRVQEYLGHYLPSRSPHVFTFKKDRIEHWLKQGAQPSDTVARLLSREGVSGLEKYIKKYTKQKKKKESPEEAAAPAAGAPAAEKPAEEKPAEPVEEAPKDEKPAEADATTEKKEVDESAEAPGEPSDKDKQEG